MRQSIRVARWTALAMITALTAMPACSRKHASQPTGPNPTPPPLPASLSLVTVGSGFNSPVFLTSPPGDHDRLFVVEQRGAIRILENGTTLATPFLTVGGLANGYEQGLLSLAFDPQYTTNGRFYVFANSSAQGGDVVVIRYHVSSDHTFSNHNGGLLLFGPDGKLYVGVGDGGGSGDPFGNGQNHDDLLGNILRVDVSSGSGYAVPGDNPWAGNPVWCYGLRNPWRFSFDRQTGDLYIADVGQDAREEVDFAPASTGRGRGANFGWSITEGTACYNPASGCDRTGLIEPVLDYGHTGGANCIIGGYVYRGAAIAGLEGHYFYADNGTRWLKSFRIAGGAAVDHTDWNVTLPDAPLSFGEDQSGELYVLCANGEILRLAP
jgi:glucose/arabinose dehydrogenase